MFSDKLRLVARSNSRWCKTVSIEDRKAENNDSELYLKYRGCKPERQRVQLHPVHPRLDTGLDIDY